jgi:lipoyl synthase
LGDGGAQHIYKTIKAVKSLCPSIIVETLIPDFNGNTHSIKKVVESGSEVISHNIETVRRLTCKIRDFRASYEQSLSVLKKCKVIAPSVYTKSSIMLGLGEHENEIVETMKDLRSAGVEIVTMGQYLQSTSGHLPVVEYN